MVLASGFTRDRIDGITRFAFTVDYQTKRCQITHREVSRENVTQDQGCTQPRAVVALLIAARGRASRPAKCESKGHSGFTPGKEAPRTRVREQDITAANAVLA